MQHKSNMKDLLTVEFLKINRGTLQVNGSPSIINSLLQLKRPISLELIAIERSIIFLETLINLLT